MKLRHPGGPHNSEASRPSALRPVESASYGTARTTACFRSFALAAFSHAFDCSAMNARIWLALALVSLAAGSCASARPAPPAGIPGAVAPAFAAGLRDTLSQILRAGIRDSAFPRSEERRVGSVGRSWGGGDEWW